jgi:hypothetical protein
MTIDASRDPAPRVMGEDGDAGRVAAIGIRLVEDAYLAWTAAASESGQALRAWLDAGGARREEAYPVYRAALDREEAAARDLQRLSEIAAGLAAQPA